jgi:flagellar biosynthesis GTPase FlhF
MRMPWFACYDDAADAAAAKAAADAVAAKAAADAAEGDETVQNQDQLNSVLKREKEKFKKEREKLAKQLEDHKNTARLTQEQKDALEGQIEELRSANLTVEERARHQLTKAQKDADEKLNAEAAKAKNWESRYQDLKIGYEIATSATTHEVLPNSVVMVEALLRPRTRLVQDQDEEGHPVDHWTAKVKFDDVDKDGKPVQLDLKLDDAIKRMKELPDRFGNLFAGQKVGGVGGNTGTLGKKHPVGKMTTKEYMEARKKDPASVGL